ncbi:kinetochor protein Mis14/NSL1 [Geosmithia morbida]|uniref:Kinetochor protein Mis14/NSL1 n=1 Tax=Geosmithia morbida TaxID=1094350 RepID=A0A9P4YZX7_9HYPO|nr:kinetochor protein Mis14/NSL1 [Geosmithia morbida]KAF4126141.1 kinetochor protein Mis14/NSL1 [Geosmithia morbida]
MSESLTSQVQRKIELQTPEDLSYLISNVRNAAATRLNEAFPPVDGAGDDVLRTQIEALVNEYIDKTFALATPNLSINGLPVQIEDFIKVKKGSGKSKSKSKDKDKDPPVAHEPFDARKRQRVADLTTQEEKLLEEVASLKRSVPPNAAGAQADVLREGMRRDDELLRAVRSRLEELGSTDASTEVQTRTGVELEPFDRQGAVEDEYRRAVDALASLKSDMSAVVAKMERARVAGQYVVDQ